MRASIRLPAHALPPRIRDGPPEDESPDFHDRPCYVFNAALRRDYDDAWCHHCRHYLTSTCPHIDEFLEDVEDLTPE